MDKSTLETYEFIPVDTETGSDQFFVVQDDGTYLINRPVQYVTEVQDVKTVLDGVQSCTVYDVSEQPFFVDVDNSSELMSVSDQFVLPDTPNNLFANNYLLQTGTPDQMEEDITEVQFKPSTSTMELDLEAGDSKTVNNCTEITLSNEQYDKLQRKGLLLLELNEKVYMLDTLGGLRDITTNDKLIQKLKNDDQAEVNWDKRSECVVVETKFSPVNDIPNLTLQPNAEVNATAQNTVYIEQTPMAISDESKENVPQKNAPLNTETVKTIESKGTTINEAICAQVQNTDSYKDVNIFLVENEKHEEQNSKGKNVIRIKTKLSIKDIPDKIVLGKTTSGKNLVARVKRIKVFPKTAAKTRQHDSNSKNSDEVCGDPEEMLFTDLIQQAIQIPEQHITSKDVQSIEMIIAQLAQVPTFDNTIQNDDYLFITKILKTKSDKGHLTTKTKPIIWTGCVKVINNQWLFEHSPYMLQELLFSNDCTSSTVIHIQILEEVCLGTNVVKTSVTVNKKQLLPGKPMTKDTVYACSACASVFDWEYELEEHRDHCFDEMNDNTHIDNMDKTINIACIMSGKSKCYVCTQCDTKFTTLNACKKHLNIHRKTNGCSNNEETNKNTNGDQANKGIFKCNMCSSVYLYSSSLTKHILSSHLKKSIN